MNLAKFFILIFCALFFLNCNKDEKIVFLDTNITTKNNILVEVNIPKATGNNQVSKNINTEIESAIISMLNTGIINEDATNSLENRIDTFNNEYRIFKADFSETNQIWEAQIDGEVMSQSHEATSVAITSYINTGGVHGILKVYFLNFNSKTGLKIENSKLFKNIEKFKEIAKPYIESALKDKGVFLNANELNLPENMGYNETGLVLLYNVNELGPDYNDMIEFSIPYSEIQSCLAFYNF